MTDTTPIPGAEHDIPPLTPEAQAALAEVDSLDPEAIAPVAAAEPDPHTARELRSRVLMLKAGAGPADAKDTGAQ